MAPLDFVAQFRDREGQKDPVKARWYIVAATALAAASAGSDIPELYRMATDGLPLETEKLVQRRIKEAILKSTPLYGVPRSLQALIPLFSILKDEQIDHYGPRVELFKDPNHQEKINQRARAYFDTIWTPEAAQANRDKNYKYQPDLWLLNLEFVYGWWFSEDSILSNVETQMCHAAALICSNCPVQALWHTRGVVRHGGLIEDAKFAQDLGLSVAQKYQCKTGEIAKVDDIPFDDKTPH